MQTESVTYVVTSDLSGKLRGKGLPVDDLNLRGGVGWTPTNAQITCFDTIAPSPYGAFGDLELVADRSTRARVDFEDGGPVEDFVLGDVRNGDGTPWSCCTRTILKRALEHLEAVSGLHLRGAFEHEFHMPGRTAPIGEGFTASGFRSERLFVESTIAALRQAGLTPDTVVREYGAHQFEITVKPSRGVTIADQAAILRELTRATAERQGKRASFAPMQAKDAVGNGVHIHLGLHEADGRPATYDPDGRHGLSRHAGAFVAGILHHLPALVAFTAPSAISYDRLQPHRWSAAFTNLAVQDREAGVRICPGGPASPEERSARYHVEFRAADGAASPHLQLAALALAGAAGIEAGLDTPEATAEDLSLLSAEALAARGIARLPGSLEDALERLEADATVRSWFPEGFVEIYLAHKREEIRFVQTKSEDEIYALYAQTY